MRLNIGQNSLKCDNGVSWLNKQKIKGESHISVFISVRAGVTNYHRSGGLKTQIHCAVGRVFALHVAILDSIPSISWAPKHCQV